jgi:hypothetical protein
MTDVDERASIECVQCGGDFTNYDELCHACCVKKEEYLKTLERIFEGVVKKSNEKDGEIAALKFQLTEALEWKQRWKDAAETAKDLYLAKVETK